MSDPLQLGSGASTPDSATTWDAVDREIMRLAASSPALVAKPDAAPLRTIMNEDAVGGMGPSAALYNTTAAARMHTQLARRRVVLLLCASVLSVGSHYSTYTLGPIKKSLGTTESSFAGFISSFEVLNTVTPLVSGFLVPRFGAAACGLAATGAVLLGQLIVCAFSRSEGGIGKNVGGVVVGLLIFGSGTSPLAVVQESIILKHNSSSSRFVARSVAAGLVLGKSASFAAGWSSQRLYSISPRLPFVTATSLALFSFAACVIYAVVERSTARLTADAALHTLSTDEPAASKVTMDDSTAHHRPVHLSSLARFGTAFWWYIAVCVLAGSWYTTQHLSTHLLQAVYDIPQSEASSAASLLLGAPVLLYPLVGWLVDKHPHLLSAFWLAVPSLTATSYFILLLLSPAVPPVLALLPAAIGMGSGPLLSVLVVPRIVQRHQAPTALGAHKSLEMAGAILSQTLSAALLSAPGGAQWCLAALLVAALGQLGLVGRWWGAVRAREGERGAAQTRGGGEEGGGEGEGDEAALGLLAPDAVSPRAGTFDPEAVLLRGSTAQDGEDEDGHDELLSRRARIELRDGRRALRAAAATVVASWGCFAWNVARG